MRVKGVALQPSSRVAGAMSLCFLWQPVTIINGQTNCLSLSSIDAVQPCKGVRIQRSVSVTYRSIDCCTVYYSECRYFRFPASTGTGDLHCLTIEIMQ